MYAHTSTQHSSCVLVCKCQEYIYVQLVKDCNLDSKHASASFTPASLNTHNTCTRCRSFPIAYYNSCTQHWYRQWAVLASKPGKHAHKCLESVHTFTHAQAAGHSSATAPAVPPMLVLAPTRELALQVASACRQVQKLTGLRTACIYGGVPKEQQVR